MKEYNVQPDLTNAGLNSLVRAVKDIQKGLYKRVDLGHGTIMYKIPTNNPKKFTIRIDMKVEEE